MNNIKRLMNNSKSITDFNIKKKHSSKPASKLDTAGKPKETV